MNPEHWELEFYQNEQGTFPCLDFIEGLSTEGKKAAIRYALANILARQGPDVCDTEFGKSLKRGLYEFRLRHTESELLARVRPDLAAKVQEAADDDKVLLRVFFHAYGNKIVLLLGGYDKGEDPKSRRQDREISEARRALKAWQEEQRRADRAGVRSARGVLVERSFLTYWRRKRRSSRRDPT